MSKYSAGNMGRKPNQHHRPKTVPNLCIRYCNVQANVLEQMTLYGETKPHKDNYYLDAFLNSQLQTVLRCT